MLHRKEFISASDGVQLFWQAWEPDRPARSVVCLLHGIGEHTGRYSHVADALVAANIAMHAIDLRGHGQSEGPRGHTPSLEQWLDDIDLMLERAGTRQGRFLYGHSLGGSLAIIHILNRFPTLSGVIASGPAFRRSFDVPAIKVFLGKLMANVWPTFSQHSGLDPRNVSRDPAVVKAYAEDPLVHDWATARLFIVATVLGEDALARAPDFHAPLLLLQASEDRLVDVGASEAFFVNAGSTDKTLRLYEDFYHEVHNEPQKDSVIEEIVQWVLNRS
ncbi:MAG: alpha/beta fold hydrolase [Anaerolineales bacterium]|nr:alpha/beta fold hydrolase [Anaerolineales bacterium]